MANIQIRTNNPVFASGITEGVNAVALRRVSAECARLQAVNGVRAYGDSVRWESVAGALAVKYSTPRHGRLYGAILGAWALLWMVVFEWYEFFSAWNREG